MLLSPSSTQIPIDVNIHTHTHTYTLVSDERINKLKAKMVISTINHEKEILKELLVRLHLLLKMEIQFLFVPVFTLKIIQLV